MAESVAEAPTLELPPTDTAVLEAPTEVLPVTGPEPEPIPPATDAPHTLKIQILDESDAVHANASDFSDERIRQDTTERGVKGFIKRIWHGNIARDYYRQKYVREGRTRQLENRDIYALEGGSLEDHRRAMAAPVMRFTSEYAALHQDEKNEAAALKEGGTDLESGLTALVSRYASKEIEAAELEEATTRLLDVFATKQRVNDRNKGLIYAHNVLEVAENARAAVEHGLALEAIKAATEVRVGEARMGVRTAASREAIDKAVDAVYSTRVGSVVNEATISTAAAVGLGLSKFTVRKLVTAVAATVGMGVGAGVVAGIRESHHVTQERRLNSRQMAEGGEVEAGSKRRQKMEATRYETVSATDLLDQLQTAVAEHDTIQGKGSVTRLLAQVLDVQTRIRMSDDLNVDLIRYDSKLLVEEQRLELDIALAKAKVTLQEYVDSSDDATLHDLGVERGPVDDIISARDGVLRNAIEGDMSAKDQVFARLRLNRTLAAATIGLVAGVTLGTAIEEGKAAIQHSLQGVFEHQGAGVDRRTELAALFRNQTQPKYNLAEGKNFADSAFKVDNSALDLPAGYHVTHNLATNAYELIGSNDKVVANDLTFSSDGHLSEASTMLLQKQGFGLHATTEVFQTSHVETQTVGSTPDQYIAAHQGQFTEVQRQLWYANNTPNIFDKNELKLDWGGANGTGMDAQGNYVFNVSHMTPDGSYEGGVSANAQQLIANHQLAIAISVSEGTQAHVIMGLVGANGEATFSPNDPVNGAVFQSVFQNVNGHATFNGGFAECVQLLGQNQQGAEEVRMLATVVGNNQPHAINDVITNVVHQSGEHVVTHIEVPETPLPIEVTPVVAIRSRRGMEALTTREERVAYGYGEYSSEQRDQLERERSPRLRRNPDAVLNPEEELRWYRRELARTDREALEIVDGIIESTPELSALPASTEAIVCIPVGAVGEADNIYNTLSLYAQQDDDAKNKTTLLLHVNWIDDAEADVDKKQNIDRTLAEIERAKTDFPDLRIASFQTVWPRSFVTRRKGIIGEVARRMFDTALLSVERANRQGEHDADRDVLIIRNDADAQGMSNHYLRNLLQAAETKENTDGFVGTVRWQTERHDEFPGFGVVSNFREVMHAVSGLRGVKTHIPTIGINSSVRASMLAAVGCLGHGKYIGAGSDDLEIGARIYAARRPAGGRGARRTYYGQASTSPTPELRNSRRLRSLTHLAGRRYYAQSGSEVVHAQPIALVAGATIDTQGDRMLLPYREGRPVTDAWNDFDRGGHTDRSSSVTGLPQISEEDTGDIAEIASRVELNISSMISRWFRDPAQARMGLAFVFPEKTSGGDAIYQLSWHDGEAHFVLTEPGRKWLQNRLERDQGGRFDPFGARSRRRLYHEVRPGTRRRPNSEQPRLVKALA